MAFQGEFRRRSWSVIVLLNVFMAGFAGNPGSAIGADVYSSLDTRPSPGTTDQKSREPQDEPVGSNEPEVANPERKSLVEHPTLQWDSPFTRVDGSKLYPGEIGGYRVYYRLRHQDKYRSLVVEGPDAESLELAAFEAGDYEFAVSTLDVDGLESRRSNPVSVNLPRGAGECSETRSDSMSDPECRSAASSYQRNSTQLGTSREVSPSLIQPPPSAGTR